MDMSERPAYWAVVPAVVRYDPDLPPNAKLLYGEITALLGRKGYCYAQNAYFEELFGLSERSVTRLLSALVKGGHIKVEVVRDERTQEVLERRIYAAYDGAAVEPDPPDNFDGTPPDDFDGTPPDKNGGENSTSYDYNPPPIVPPKGDGARKPKKARQEPKRAPDWKPERFDGFWKFYPRGENKQGAIRAWDKLQPDDGLIAEMGRALQRQMQRPDWQQGVGIPYASTWLNQRRWEDEERQPLPPPPPTEPLPPQRWGWD